MSIEVNTNYEALVATNSYNTDNNALNKSITELSTGLRINSAVDDPAGLEISQNMTAQIGGLNQAVMNMNEGVNLASTAESALGQQEDLLDQMNTLAVEAVNGTNSASDSAALQAEMNQLTVQYDSIATTTSYNGVQLLNGSYTNQTFQLGAFSGQTMTVNVGSARAAAVGNNALILENDNSANGLGQANVNTTLANALTVDYAQTVTISGAALGTITLLGNQSAAAVATAINANASATGVSATATTVAVLGNLSNTGTVSFNLDDSTFAAANISASITNTQDLTALMNAINASSGTTGITAAFTSAGRNNLLTLTAADGGNIQIANANNSGGSAGPANFTISGSQGNAIGVATGLANNTALITGTVALSSILGFSASSNLGNITGSIMSAAAGQLETSALNSVSAINISTQAGAVTAITTIQEAIQSVSNARSSLGATEIRFQNAAANDTNTTTQMQDALGTEQDVDFASATANFTQQQILVQAANSMLSQAATQPQAVLALLQKL